MYSGFLRREEWPFEVDAQHARVRSGGLIRGLKSSAHSFGLVGDQRRQERRGPELSMCAGDGRHRGRTWIVIQKDVAAAVHLDVDKARGEPRAFRQRPGWHPLRDFPLRQQTGNAAPLYDDRVIIMASLAIEDNAGHDGMPTRFRHRVLVTFRK